MRYIATIGFFDGVHLGHQYLLSQMKEEAAKRGLKSAIVTFDEHPQKVLQGKSPALLTTCQERMAMLKGIGVDEIFRFNFELIHTMSADEFAQLLHDSYHVDVLIMGYDHRFGCTQSTIAGTAHNSRNGAQSTIEIIRLPELPSDEHISSTQIRQALLAGEIVRANEMLGYAYPLIGKVVHGKALGRTIGFPTANIEVDPSKLIPAPGVYVAEWNFRRVLLNINDSIEMHIPHFEGDLYGQAVLIELIARVREEKHFDNLEQLKTQIQKDLLQL